MFSLERGMRYWLYSEPTDMRKSFHTLSGLVRNKIGGDPMNGDVYIFVNKRRNRIKLLHYETGGMVIYAKMLDRGTFGMPIPGSKDVVTRGKIQWGFYDDNGKETERVTLDANGEPRMLNVERDRWHSLVCLESGSVLYESKDGPYRPLGEEEVMGVEDYRPGYSYPSASDKG